jgi:hypothetical protein
MPNMADTVKAKERYAIGVAGSLEEMVGRTAFERCRVAIQPHRVELTHDVRQADALRRLDATMRILRLHRLWFSTGWGACYEGHGLVVTATQPGDYALSVIVAGPDAIEVATAADRLVSYLGVTIKRQAPPPA